MTNYYIKKDNKIVFIDTNKEKLQRTVGKDINILETERPLVLSDDGTEFVFADTSEYEQEQIEKEAERIAMLNLTAADVERGIYKAKGMDFDDIITFLETQPLAEDGSPVVDIKALKIELKANNFYRGNPYVETIGKLLGFTDEQLNAFFEDGNYEHLLQT